MQTRQPNARLIAIAFAVMLTATTAAAATVAVYFSPTDAVATQIADRINAANSRVFMAAYVLSEQRIREALRAAKQRGLDVRLIVDRRQETSQYSSAPAMAKAGIAVKTDAWEPLHHNKFVVVDSTITITGSANFSRGGTDDNAENVVVITDTAVNAAYAANFTTHWNHSRAFDWQPYATRKKPLRPTDPNPEALQFR
jgi:phosphatidylserine/phosphatidylglycerophosphate/cardiolipin synthase-like enzyme